MPVSRILTRGFFVLGSSLGRPAQRPVHEPGDSPAPGNAPVSLTPCSLLAPGGAGLLFQVLCSGAPWLPRAPPLVCIRGGRAGDSETLARCSDFSLWESPQGHREALEGAAVRWAPVAINPFTAGAPASDQRGGTGGLPGAGGFPPWPSVCPASCRGLVSKGETGSGPLQVNRGCGKTQEGCEVHLHHHPFLAPTLWAKKELMGIGENCGLSAQ